MRDLKLMAYFLGISFFSFFQSALAFDDPFTPYLNSIPPITQTISNTNTGSGSTAITTKEITFSSRSGVNTVYAVMAYPQQAGKYPAVLCLHGGGSDGVQLITLVQDFARRGYVAISPDLPGICGTTNTPYSTGPWKSRPAGEGPRFDVASGPQNSTLVDAEVAAMEAFNLMRSQANVDTTRMGIMGYSWGGYSTTMLSGLLGAKVKASYAVFGCGFYDAGSNWTALIDTMSAVTRTTWLTFLDAGRREPNMKAAYFLEAETDDTFFWPEAVAATVNAVPGIKNHVWGPNLNHNQLPNGPAMVTMYFDYYLKAIGSAFSTVAIPSAALQTDSSRKVLINVTVPGGVTLDSVRLYYSQQAANWQVRNWIPLIAKLETGTTYSAVLSAALVKSHVDYYAFVIDTRKFASSSLMYNAASDVTSVSGPATGKCFQNHPVSPFATYTRGFISIKGLAGESRKAISVNVYASNGKRIAQQRSTSAIMPVFLSEGVYVVKVANSSGSHWISKLVVAK
jgi:dienelactone hydrolase